MAVKKKLSKAVKKKSVKKTVIPSVEITLPEEPSDISDRMEDYTWLIYGERKIGKTTIFSHFENAVFVMFDPPQKGLRIRQVHCPDWRHFLKFLTLLERRLNEDSEYCSMLIIDTGYMCYEKCFAYKVDELGITDPQDKAWGSGWKAIAREFMEVHERIFKMGIGLGITAHAEIREVKRRDGSRYDKLTTQLGNQAFKYYNGLVDVIAYYQYTPEGRRELTLAGDQLVEAGSRIEEHFKFQDGSSIKNIPMGRSHEESFKNLQAAFYNQMRKEVVKKAKKVAKKISK